MLVVSTGVTKHSSSPPTQTERCLLLLNLRTYTIYLYSTTTYLQRPDYNVGG